MDINQLTVYAAEFLKKNYHLSLHIPITRNNRLRSTHGRFVIRNNKAYKIELAGYLLDYGSYEAIIGVLKHECIHYALFLQKADFKDGEHAFENELKKYQAPGTNTMIVGKYYLFQCRQCKKVSKTTIKKVKTHSQQYRTKCCNANIVLLREAIYDGSESTI